MKETINKVERQPSEWEEIIVTGATDKGFIQATHAAQYQKNEQYNLKLGHILT